MLGSSREGRRCRSALSASLALHIFCSAIGAVGADRVRASGPSLQHGMSAFAGPFPVQYRTRVDQMLRRPGRILVHRTSQPCVMSMEVGPKDAWGNIVGTNDAFFTAPAVQNRTRLALAFSSPSADQDVSVRDFAHLVAERAPSPQVHDWRSKDIGRWVLSDDERDDGPRGSRPISALIMGKIVIDEFVRHKQPDTEVSPFPQLAGVGRD